jgi:cell division protein FtsB
MTAAKARGRLNLKGLLLFLAAAALLVLTIAPARQVLRQRDQIAALEKQLNSIETQNDDLREETERLNTDAYIEQQARLRLGLIRPGEEPYMIVPPKQTAPSREAAPAPKKPETKKEKPSWWETIVEYFSTIFN